MEKPQIVTVETGDGFYYTKHPLLSKIDQWLEEELCLKYNKGYKLFIQDGIYDLRMDMNNSIIPYTIAGDFPDDATFFKYVTKQLLSNAGTIKYLILVDKTYGDD